MCSRSNDKIFIVLHHAVMSSSFQNKISPSVRAIVRAISNPDDLAAHPKNTFSYGIVQLIMHSLDPTPEEGD